MRLAHFAVFLIALGIAQDAVAQTSNSGASGTTAGQSMTSGPNASIATQTVPAPVNTTPPINPAPGTTSQNSLAPLTNTAPQRIARLRAHSLMGTSNTFQNGLNGSVGSNGVINGTATMTPPPLSAPAPSPSNGSTTTNNGPPNAPGTVATPTPAASTH
jgi:hypothetical protein